MDKETHPLSVKYVEGFRNEKFTLACIRIKRTSLLYNEEQGVLLLHRKKEHYDHDELVRHVRVENGLLAKATRSSLRVTKLVDTRLALGDKKVEKYLT